ncbi:Error-prone DNA polymerase [bacterium HR39]|nr:Error-prone DNA polymerase [bacterium HR39]
MEAAFLRCVSAFDFLKGASLPEEYAEAAARAGLAGFALADGGTLAGVVRAHLAAREVGIRFAVGCRLDPEDGPSLLCWAASREGYARLCRTLTAGRLRVPKGRIRLLFRDLPLDEPGLLFALLPPAVVDDAFRARARDLAELARGRLWCGIERHLEGPPEEERLAAVAELADRLRLPLLALPEARLHDPARRPLLDVLTCIRERCTLEEAGSRLARNAERRLLSPRGLEARFSDHPEALIQTAEVLARCRFSLDGLRYDYPVEEDYGGLTPQQELERRVREGAAWRWPEGVPEKVRAQLSHELRVVAELGYAPYFLTVHDIVRFARSRGILCQGRGSAANSAICYVLGITSVDPEKSDLLFERFVSAARAEPPDIDVDFEHERREEVIRWVFERYGREHAAMVATVICWRWKSALREVAGVFGLPREVQDALSRAASGTGAEGPDAATLRASGLDPEDPTLRRVLELARELVGLPRHLSQHPGGMVISRSPLCELVPVENAAMPGRTVIEWDRDDLDALGLLKIDLLGLGILSCLRRAFELLRVHKGIDLDLARIPPEDPAVYGMLARGDSIGVFQVESRAQTSMLPRLKPRCFYDLVVQVAIVRPGPIQGEMVHPYLRRRCGEEPVTFPSRELGEILGRTLGVPLFQEQAMKIAIRAAGFTPEEAEGLRRAMAAFRRAGEVARWRERFVTGMVRRGYGRDFAERCFRQIEGFGAYGFPESHAASFALLVYASAWVKCHHPDVFLAAILNSQPMGFYAPAQLVRDARAHGVAVRPVDVNASLWDCTLEGDGEGDANRRLAVRLGLRMVKGLGRAEAERLVEARRAGPFRDLPELAARTGLSRGALERLAEADAFGSLGLSRRQALWQVRGLRTTHLPLFARVEAERREGGGPVDPPHPARLREPAAGEAIALDWESLGLSLRGHPLELLREDLAARGVLTARAANALPDGARAAVAGLPIVRQRPGTAKGVVFVTLEDETGFANLILWPDRARRFRHALLFAALAVARGRIQREGEVVHLLVDRLGDASHLLRRLADRPPPVMARDFR